MADPTREQVEEFIHYVNRRGVPERYHRIYRDELVAILLHAGVGSVDRLQPEDLSRSVQQAQQRLNNRRAVCAALDAFLRSRHSPQGDEDDLPPDSIAGSRSVAVAPHESSEHRKFVRVPFKREIDVEGSRAVNRSADLSIGGMYLDTMQVYEVGSVVNIAFKLHHTDPKPLRLQARIVHFDPGVGAGLDFVDPPRQARHLIRRFVESYVLDRER